MQARRPWEDQMLAMYARGLPSKRRCEAYEIPSRSKATRVLNEQQRVGFGFGEESVQQSESVMAKESDSSLRDPCMMTEAREGIALGRHICSDYVRNVVLSFEILPYLRSSTFEWLMTAVATSGCMRPANRADGGEGSSVPRKVARNVQGLVDSRIKFVIYGSASVDEVSKRLPSTIQNFMPPGSLSVSRCTRTNRMCMSFLISNSCDDVS
eukprot:GHVU01103818.1.p1 GENE.GHVU01103818.1~~GHVU01103818.1.p1  ORF type:complete len:211 (+),score=6.09 GHVU01103818.1:217-849(+)